MTWFRYSCEYLGCSREDPGVLIRAVYAGDESTVTATNCTMASNSASLSGAVYAGFDSIATATDRTMISNSASWDGAVFYTSDDSNVTATDCTLHER